MQKISSKVQELGYELKIQDVMMTDVVTVKKDQTMGDLRKILKENRISGVAILNENDFLEGVISIDDLINCLMSACKNALISDWMISKVKTLFADEPVIHAVDCIQKTGYGRIPILDRKTGKFIGLITKGVIMTGFLKKLEIEYHEEEIRKYRASHIFLDVIADKKDIYLHYTVDGNNFDEAGRCSTSLKKTLKRLGINPDIIRRIAIASYEAEMNLVIYAGGGEMSYKISPDRVAVKVKDSGPGIADIKKALTPGFSTAPDSVRELGFGAGLGLPNIKKCSDTMELKSTLGEGTTLRFSMNLMETKK